jgi:hypothetical protein
MGANGLAAREMTNIVNSLPHRDYCRVRSKEARVTMKGVPPGKAACSTGTSMLPPMIVGSHDQDLGGVTRAAFTEHGGDINAPVPAQRHDLAEDGAVRLVAVSVQLAGKRAGRSPVSVISPRGSGSSSFTAVQEPFQVPT